MKKTLSLCCLTMLIMSVSPYAQEKSSAGITIDSMLFAQSVESRTPVDVSDVFETTVGNVSCWSLESTRELPVQIKYVWYQDGKKVFQWMVTLKTPKGRAWSTKSVTTGAWKVEITDESGKVLKTKSFTVK